MGEAVWLNWGLGGGEEAGGKGGRGGYQKPPKRNQATAGPRKRGALQKGDQVLLQVFKDCINTVLKLYIGGAVRTCRRWSGPPTASPPASAPARSIPPPPPITPTPTPTPRAPGSRQS